MWSWNGDHASLFVIFIGYYALISEGSFSHGDESGDELQKSGYLRNHRNRLQAFTSQNFIVHGLRNFHRFPSINQTGSDWKKTWNKTDLTYRIIKYPKKLNASEVDKVIDSAFDTWSDVSMLKFEKRMAGRVDIEISFERFDGPGNIIAEAKSPKERGAIQFDADEEWFISGTPACNAEEFQCKIIYQCIPIEKFRDERPDCGDGTDEGVDLLHAAIHEIGHSLGLKDSDIDEAIMAPYYFNSPLLTKLHDDDIKAIQTLYGRRESLPEESTIPLPDLSTAPNLCTNTSIDTITMIQNGSTYVFKGHFYWEVTRDGLADGYPRIISEDWRGLRENLDASFTRSDGKTFFFKGTRYWRFTNKNMDRGYPKRLNQGFDGIPSKVDAAFVWSKNRKTYFFKGENYWAIDWRSDPPVANDYPKPIRIWKGIPNNIDAVFQWENDRTYFFKGDQYYRFDDIQVQVERTEPPYPRSTALGWFKCDRSTADTSNELYR